MFENPLLRSIDWFYAYFIKIGNNLQSLFLLYMRLTWGHQFFMSGFGKFGNIDMVASFFQSLHIAYPYLNAYLVASLELVGGICLFFGLASRLITIPLIVIMLTALSTAHSHVLIGFRFIFEPSSIVHETPYPYLITCLLVFIFGPGKISLDGWLKRWVDRQPKY